jgi:hypothetical protein
VLASLPPPSDPAAEWLGLRVWGQTRPLGRGRDRRELLPSGRGGSCSTLGGLRLASVVLYPAPRFGCRFVPAGLSLRRHGRVKIEERRNPPAHAARALWLACPGPGRWPLLRPSKIPHEHRDSEDGANRDRTGDLLLAKQALSQLSYGPRTLQYTRYRGDFRVPALATSAIAEAFDVSCCRLLPNPAGWWGVTHSGLTARSERRTSALGARLTALAPSWRRAMRARASGPLGAAGLLE